MAATASPRSSRPDDARFARIRRALLRWYDRHARDLPWRARPGRGANAYHVMVSEAMLQQTQVATVIGYFQHFIAELPDITALAEADEQQVLRLWQGLGYYRRARHLHQAARAIVAEHGGRIPQRAAELTTLPGVGRYTAGAIGSIAFGQRTPIVDGNVARVLARWFAIAEPIDASTTRHHLWELAGRLVPPGRPGDFNQAMMELGATVCTPRNPACDACPVARWCDAHEAGRAAELPITSARRAPKTVTHRIVAVARRGQYLFEQRPATGLWANMWQLPTAEDIADDDRAADALAAWLAGRHKLMAGGLKQFGRFTHQTTHRTIAFELWRADRVRGRRTSLGVWRELDALNDLPMANPQVKAVGMLVNGVA